MSEPPQKKMKLTENLPEDLVEYIISTYFPIQYILQSRVVSKQFNNALIQSRDLDFSCIYSVRRNQSTVVGIIEDVFNQHKGPKINRFVLILNHIGVEDKILSWIKTCLARNIQELVLDFSKARKTMKIPVDFSAIETLTILKLRWCKFDIPNNNIPKGLKLLKILALMKTKVTTSMIDSIFSNCIHLEALELIKCQMHGVLNINAKDHDKFKSLVVSSMPKLLNINVDAPTLECFKYDGFVKNTHFLRVDAFKEANLHYNRSFNWRYYDSSDMVYANMEDYTRVHVLKTIHIFLEALKERYICGQMRKRTSWIWNLKEFHILFKAPTICTLYHIAEFLKQCPKLEKVLIDIKNFTFEPSMFWDIHHKRLIEESGNYKLDSIKEVMINGYKNHWHELDIVKFFVLNSKSLKMLELTMLRNAKNRAHRLDYAMIDYIKIICPCVEVKEV